MFRYIVALGLTYMIFTENGQKLAKEFLKQSAPLAEKYIVKPVIESFKKEDKN